MTVDLFGLNTSDAVFSPCTADHCADRDECENHQHRPYRYRLMRTWDPDLPIIPFLMLNPSVAGRERNDPTIRRCMGFSRSWNYGGMIGLNLFGLRSTDPKGLIGHPDPIGPDNDQHISEVVTEHGAVILAWGSHRMVSPRAAVVLQMLAELDVELLCLGRTQTGRPKHPLYVPYGDPIPYERSA